MKKFLMYLLVLTTTFVLNQSMSSCGAMKSLSGVSEQTMTLPEIDPTFGPYISLLEGASGFKGVKYSTCGEANFDAFFKSAAKLNGLNDLSINYSNSLAKGLMNAMTNITADGKINDQLKEIDNDKDLSDVEKTVKKADVLKKEKLLKKSAIPDLATTAKSLAVLAVSMVNSANTISDLVNQGSSLLSNVSSLPPTKVPGVTASMKDAIGNLKEVGSKFQGSVKNIVTLSTLFSGFDSSEE